MWHYKGDFYNRSESQSSQEGLWELLAPSEAGAAVLDLKVKIMFYFYMFRPLITFIISKLG